MIRKIFTHKFLPIIAVFMLVLFTLTTSCFGAMTYTMEDGSELILETLPDILYSDIVLFKVDINSTTWKDFDYFLCTYNSSEGVFAYPYYDFSTDVPCPITNIRFSFIKSLNDVSTVRDGNMVRCYSYNSSTGVWKLSSEGTYNLSLTGNIVSYYSTKDIYSFKPDDSNNLVGDVVFQGAPLPITQVELMKPIQVEEIPAQIVGIVKIVLPIFLIIFGVLLVLYLIKSKNLLQL